MAKIIDIKSKKIPSKDIIKAVKNTAKKVTKLIGNTTKKKKHKNRSGKSTYEIPIPKNISRKLRRQRKY